MLRALLGAGVVPHAFVGCSVGALNSAFLACEPTAERVEVLAEHWTQLRSSDIFAGGLLTMASHLLRRRPYLYRTYGLERLIRDWAPVARIEQLPTPLRVVTAQLSTGQAVYHDTGCLRDCLLASTALPALFPPVGLPDHVTGESSLHVDGAVADLVPVAGAVGLRPTHVYILDATIPPLIPRLRSPLAVLVASLGIATRIRPQVDFGDSVTVTHIKTADQQQTGLTSFGWSRQLIRWGQEAAIEALAGASTTPTTQAATGTVAVHNLQRVPTEHGATAALS